MADGGDDKTLIKVAVFGIAFSLIVTAMVSFYAEGTGDYSYDEIAQYRTELINFSGDSMINETPWVLTHAYTPFIPGTVNEEDIPNHTDEAGWLFGTDLPYSEIGKVKDIKLDVNYKSNQLLTVGDPYSYSYQSGREWWNGGNDFGVVLADPWLANLVTFGNAGDGYTYTSGAGNNWNYSGLRYTFDPVLPFSNGTSAKDGQLSLVWYNFGDETGLSGGLDIYGPGHKDGQSAAETRLASISASDIILGYQSNSGYATVYDFDFNGITLHLSIKFNPDILPQYPSMRAAWDAGAWTLAISSVSAGNFFDVESSNSFVSTAGSMIDTFIQIYTFSYPEFDNDPWANVVLWLMCGLPMTMAMLLVSMRLVGGIFKVF